ncbi:hypothetical protein [Pseudozobellia sp. WGM2]|uniref:hypothetical protein n=1 Tax=Pseudozobellia sp. WGM2 TaxID=2787625 RepID=UPI001AE0B8AB|nr:hypothetical protein [Pseudozobellia sp. WGM2]
MDVKTPYVFQVDSEIVQEVYQHRDNYKIVFDKHASERSTVAIYFSSNDIYYPNEELVFKQRIVEKDAFEWYGTRIKNAYKHIFIRDVFKQWYLKGINKELDSIEKVASFLRKETQGCHIVALGSSSGGFAAVLFGSLLGAKKIVSFNGQFEVHSLLKTSKPSTDPILFRNKDTALAKQYDIKPLINPESNIYYFYSNASPWDITQREHVSDLNTLQVIEFKTGHHGIPFLKRALPKVINLSDDRLKELSQRTQQPVWFSIKMIGFKKVLIGTYLQLRDKYQRRK